MNERRIIDLDTESDRRQAVSKCFDTIIRDDIHNRSDQLAQIVSSWTEFIGKVRPGKSESKFNGKLLSQLSMIECEELFPRESSFALGWFIGSMEVSILNFYTLTRSVSIRKVKKQR